MRLFASAALAGLWTGELPGPGGAPDPARALPAPAGRSPAPDAAE